MKPRIWRSDGFWKCACIDGDEPPGHGDTPFDAWADWLCGLWLAGCKKGAGLA